MDRIPARGVCRPMGNPCHRTTCPLLTLPVWRGIHGEDATNTLGLLFRDAQTWRARSYRADRSTTGSCGSDSSGHGVEIDTSLHRTLHKVQALPEGTESHSC